MAKKPAPEPVPALFDNALTHLRGWMYGNDTLLTLCGEPLDRSKHKYRSAELVTVASTNETLAAPLCQKCLRVARKNVDTWNTDGL